MNYIFKATPEHFQEITRVWEASVRATHDFLPDEDILYYKELILNEYLYQVDIYYIKNDAGRIIAFIGISDKHLEMLFIHPAERKKGLGKQLICFVVKQLKAETVDVNEQNPQAVGFYQKMGYEITGRDATDGNGKPYPVLHMKLGKAGISFPCELQLVEKHPLGFYLPANTRLLMLGSFPPKQERWSMNFYYPNIQNDMWRILGLLFYKDKEHFLLKGKKAFDEQKAKKFCNEMGIGIGDTADEIVRLKDNASDKFLEVVSPLNAEKVLGEIQQCKAVVITGQKAMDTFLSIIPAEEPAVGGFSKFTYMERSFRLYRMPSSSRAYPKPLKEKAAIYGKMFKELGFPIIE